MKAIIYCFSGTGNTLFAARETVKALTSLGIETDIYRIVSEDSPLYAVAWVRSVSFGKFEVCSTNKKEGACLTDSAYGYIPDPNNYDIAGFGYPIHSYNAPQFFVNFIKALPKLNDDKKGMKAFLFKTSGKRVDTNDASSWAASRVLKNKGFFPCIDMNIPMPNIMFRYQDGMVKQMALSAIEASGRLAKMIQEGNFPLCDFNPFHVLYSIPFRFQSLAARFNGYLYTVDQKRCTSCGKCVYTCSSGNIYIVGRTSIKDPKKVFRLPQIGGDCTMCMQCTVTCPHGAITPGILKNRKLNSGWNFRKLLADDSIIPSDQIERMEPGDSKKAPEVRITDS